MVSLFNYLLFTTAVVWCGLGASDGAGDAWCSLGASGGDVGEGAGDLGGNWGRLGDGVTLELNGKIRKNT